MIQAIRDIHFAAPWWFLALLVVPPLLLLVNREGAGRAVLFPALSLIPSGRTLRDRCWGFRPSPYLIPIIAVIFALARPQLVDREEIVEGEGIAILLTVDVSLSMNIEDFRLDGRPVNRLTVAKRVMGDFVSDRDHDRVGIVAFAGRPYVPSPLTLDRAWIERGIDRIQIGVVGEQGTAIGSAIAAAARRLDSEETDSKVIILLTDGASNSGKLSPVDAAKLARTLGIRIYTIAIGTYGMHPIPLADGSGRVMPAVQQEFDEETLMEIAEIGQGKFYLAQDTETLAQIFDEIDELERTEFESFELVEVKELFHWPLALALLSTLALITARSFRQP